MKISQLFTTTILLSCLPVAAADFTEFSPAVSEIPYCLGWTTSQVCHMQTVCKYVCSAAVGGVAGAATGSPIGAGIGSGIGSQACENICEQVPDCHTEQVCTHYSTEP